MPAHDLFVSYRRLDAQRVRPLVDFLRNHAKKPSAAIIGEPTSMQVVNGHKSAVRFSTEVTGHESHSALTDQGVNAIMVAGEIIHEISKIREELIAIGDASNRYDPPYSTIHIGVIPAAPPTTLCRSLAASIGKPGYCPTPMKISCRIVSPH